MTLIELARKLRPLIEQAAASLPDPQAAEAAPLFPALKQDGSLIRAGTRIRWQGSVMKAAADLWDREENSPDRAPNLWTELRYREGMRIAPEVFTAGNAAALGECLWFGDSLYRSDMEGNTFRPTDPNAPWTLLKTVPASQKGE